MRAPFRASSWVFIRDDGDAFGRSPRGPPRCSRSGRGSCLLSEQRQRPNDIAGLFRSNRDSGAPEGRTQGRNAVAAGRAATERQEYYAGEAEDRAAVITIGQEQVHVPFGHFTDQVLMTRDLVPLEPTVQELKFYAPGVGPVLSVHLDGNGGRAELITYSSGPG